MASDSVYGQLANFDVVAINNGELVRITANKPIWQPIFKDSLAPVCPASSACSVS